MKYIYKISLLALLISTGLQAYEVIIQNSLPEQAMVRITYGGAALCGPEDIPLKAGEVKKLNVGACCTSQLEITGLTGIFAGTKAYFRPQSTGFGLVCRSFKAIIKKSVDNRIIVEEERDMAGHSIGLRNTTNGEVLALIVYAGAGVCTQEYKLLAPGQRIVVKTGTCCTDKIVLEALSGDAKGSKYTLVTPRVGLNMTCASYDVDITVVTGKIFGQAKLHTLNPFAPLGVGSVFPG